MSTLDSVSAFTSAGSAQGAAVPAPPPQRKVAVSNAVFGTLVFVITEAMFFMGLISSFLVSRANSFGQWHPPGDITLPRLATGFNTLVLLGSGLLLFLATRSHAREPGNELARRMYSQATILGAFFVAFQGFEWVKLINYGMTMNSGLFGATFFLLIGSHGLHALGAVLALAWCGRRMARGELSVDRLKGLLVFWSFIVGLWPVLYGLVYFG